MDFPTPDAEKYQALAVLHKGSFRSVVLLEENQSGENVAAHVISPPPAISEEQMTKGMQAQADRYARLKHERLQPFLEHNFSESQHWFLFRYIKGFPLNQFMGQTEDVSADWITEWLIQLLEALQYLHQEGEVLGGLNPSDIVMDLTGQLYVVDLGLLEHAFPELTAMLRSETRVALMAPEERYTAQITTSTDLFSAGAIAYWLATGRLLKKPLQTGVADTVRELVTARGQLQAPVAEVIAELIQFRPSERCSDATQALERVRPYRPALERADPPAPSSTFGVSVRPLTTRTGEGTPKEKRPKRLVVEPEPIVESVPEPLPVAVAPSRKGPIAVAAAGVVLLVLGARMFGHHGGGPGGAPATMTLASGGIMINDKQGADWRPDSAVTKGNTLVTAIPAQGTASLTFGRRGKLSLDPGTTIRVNELTDHSVDVRITDGHAWLDTPQDLPCTLEVGGGRIVCPEGSSMDVALTPSEAAKVRCDKGTVTVHDGNQDRTLNAGEQMSINDTN